MSKTPAAKPDDSYAPSMTIQYIDRLQQDLNAVNYKLKSKNSSLSSAKTQKDDVTEKYDSAKSLDSVIQLNLDDANTALENIGKITQFFHLQVSQTDSIANYAKTTAEETYEALEYLIAQGIYQVDQVADLVTAGNEAAAAKGGDATAGWQTKFTGTITKAQAAGSAALKTGETAATAAFGAYVTSERINTQTKAYLKGFLSFQAQLQSVMDRLVVESALAKRRLDSLDNQLIAADKTVSDLTAAVSKLQTQSDKLQAEFSAAQQGASYSASSAKVPA